MNFPLILRKLYAEIMKIFESIFVQNIAWMTGVSVLERIAALLQTIIIARTLGITEYGVYGLLFGTIGFTASVAGLQMGLTATVFVARYKTTNKAKARRIIQYVNRFALIVSAVLLLSCLPFSRQISIWLLSSGQYEVIIVMGCVFIVGSLLSGVQDGVAQGFEDFKAVAIIKALTSLATLAVIFFVAKKVGLEGVLLVLLGGTLLKYLLLYFVVRRHQADQSFPREGTGVKFSDLVWGFSAPSMLTTLVWGFAAWFGMYMLSKQPAGFDEVAIVNTGIQWRGPLLLISSAISSVAIPKYSRLNSTGDSSLAKSLQSKLLWVNGAAAFLVVAVLAALVQPILGLYGDGFIGGKYIFVLIIATAVPQIIAQVYMQKLVGDGQLWLQFWLHLPFAVCLLVGFIFLIPAYAGLGFAATMVTSTLIYAVYCSVTLRFLRR